MAAETKTFHWPIPNESIRLPENVHTKIYGVIPSPGVNTLYMQTPQVRVFLFQKNGYPPFWLVTLPVFQSRHHQKPLPRPQKTVALTVVNNLIQVNMSWVNNLSWENKFAMKQFHGPSLICTFHHWPSLVFIPRNLNLELACWYFKFPV